VVLLVSQIEDNNEKFEVLQGTLVSQMDRHQEKMDAWIADMKERRKETTTCQEATEVNPEKMESNPENMECGTEYLGVLKKEDAVKPSETKKKRHIGQHLAAGRRGKPKELTRRDRGSRRKLAAACNKVSRRAAVAWLKEYSSGKFGPWEIGNRGRNCPPPE
jgi:hypothetical protein